MGDFRDNTDEQVEDFVAIEFNPTEAELKFIKRFLVCYSNGDGWSHKTFFLFLGEDDLLYEVNAYHCSCCGYDGQWNPELTSVKALLARKTIAHALVDHLIRKHILDLLN